MSLRIVHDESLKGLTKECPDCSKQMIATGELQYDEEDEDWVILFWCPNDGWYLPHWASELDPLIKDLTRGLDPSTLPLKE